MTGFKWTIEQPENELSVSTSDTVDHAEFPSENVNTTFRECGYVYEEGINYRMETLTDTDIEIDDCKNPDFLDRCL